MTTFYPVSPFSQHTLKGRILVIPAVSLGNLPQLAVDLLITSLKFQRIGWIGDGSTVMPFIGAEENGKIVTGGLELYGSSTSDIVVLQQRSPTLKAKKDEHLALLQRFIHGFAFTLILTSLDAASQDDAQLLTPYQHILPPTTETNPTTSQYIQRIQSLTPPLQLNITPTSPWQARAQPQTNPAAPYPPFLPSAGLTRRLLSVLHSSESESPHAAIGAWCVEGDNRGDARGLAELTLAILGIEGVELQEPKSWDGLFGVTRGWSGGAGQDSELYG